jgi:hypothetical protein
VDFLLAPFQYEYMQRAFVAALVVGTLCSTIGTYVVLRKLAFIGDGIAHASFAGIVVAYLRGIDYYAGAIVVAVLTALGIGFVNRRGKVSLDTAIGVLFTGAFALGVFLMSRAPRYNVDLSSFLFGNILGVSRGDLVLILTLAAVVTVSLAFLYRALLYTSFDPVVAEASGINAAFVDYFNSRDGSRRCSGFRRRSARFPPWWVCTLRTICRPRAVRRSFCSRRWRSSSRWRSVAFVDAPRVPRVSRSARARLRVTRDIFHGRSDRDTPRERVRRGPLR